MVGKRCCQNSALNSATPVRASSHMCGSPVSAMRRMMPLATTSRGASSASGCRPTMKRDAGAVDQVRALAADRLGDQRLLAARRAAEPHDRRVELHELQVGDLGPGPQRQAHAVAGGHRGVGGGVEDLAHAAGGQHDRLGVDRADAVARALAHDVQRDAGDAAVGVLEQVQDQGVVDDLDLADGVLQRRDQGAGYLLAGGVAAGVRDAVGQVAALAGERDRAVLVLVELRAQGDQAAHGRRALGRPGCGRPPRRRRRPRPPGCRSCGPRGCRRRRARRRCRPAPSGWSRPGAVPWSPAGRCRPAAPPGPR